MNHANVIEYAKLFPKDFPCAFLAVWYALGMENMNQHNHLNPQDPSYREAVVTSEEQPYDGGGWAGDGSGTDDFADYNANEASDYAGE